MSCECEGRGLLYDAATNTEYPCVCRPAMIEARRVQRRRYAAQRQAGARVRGEARSQRRPSRAQRRAEAPCTGTAMFVTDQELERRWKALREANGKPFNRRAFNTRLAYYALLRRWAAKEGATIFELTNRQLTDGLIKAGRGRQRRTVQYVMRELEAMGLIHRRHVVRGGPMPGYKDTIRVRLMPVSFVRRHARCTPPPLRVGGRVATAPTIVGKDLIPPTSSAETDPPFGGNSRATDQEGDPDALELAGSRPSGLQQVLRRRTSGEDAHA